MEFSYSFPHNCPNKCSRRKTLTEFQIFYGYKTYHRWIGLQFLNNQNNLLSSRSIQPLNHETANAYVWIKRVWKQLTHLLSHISYCKQDQTVTHQSVVRTVRASSNNQQMVTYLKRIRKQFGKSLYLQKQKLLTIETAIVDCQSLMIDSWDD
jgi:uncharacterized protein YgiM (DUF1202 family)